MSTLPFAHPLPARAPASARPPRAGRPGALLLLGLLGAVSGCRDPAQQPGGTLIRPEPPPPAPPSVRQPPSPSQPPQSEVERKPSLFGHQCYRPGWMLSTSSTLYPPLPCMPGEQAAPMLDQVKRVTAGPRQVTDPDGSATCCYDIEFDPMAPLRGRPFGAIAPLARTGAWVLRA